MFEMSRPAGPCGPDLSRQVLGIVALAAVLSGCVAGPDAGSPTPSPIVTGSIPVAKADADGTRDRDVVRAAVAAATVSEAGGHAIPWANPATGTTGVIAQISESETAGHICRRFETSRHGYDGIALYFGEVCRTPDSDWRLIEFRLKRAGDAVAARAGTAPATG